MIRNEKVMGWRRPALARPVDMGSGLLWALATDPTSGSREASWSAPRRRGAFDHVTADRVQSRQRAIEPKPDRKPAPQLRGPS